MPRFAYTARDRAGQTVTADLEAPSRRDALRVLSARGLQVASVAEVAGAAKRLPPAGAAAGSAPKASRALRPARAQAPTRRECLPFLESLYDLSTSGLSAGEAV